MKYSGLLATQYLLERSPLGGGGEGNVYRVVSDGTNKNVAKIYHVGKSTKELEDKLKYMVNNPPDLSVQNQVAWPLDVLYDNNRKFCGFVMPELSINAELKDVYKYPSTVGLSAKEKVIIAANICVVISAVHKAGYVFGDFNPRNIGVDKNIGKVVFLDTDSYHVFDTIKNKYYRCKVCADGYAAPELLEACASHMASYPNDNKQLYEKIPLPTFTKKTDDFALAIHIFKLLMNGYTPFGGIIETVTASQASPKQGNAAIHHNEYSFRPGYKPMSPAVPSLDIFPQEIVDLFTRAFLVVSSINPSQRPTSIEWYQALIRYESTLVDCSKDKLHQYYNKNKTCPFCEADIRYQQKVQGVPILPLQQKTYAIPVLTHIVRFNAIGSNGSLTAEVDNGIFSSQTILSGDAILQGKNVVFKASPTSGYRVKKWNCNNSPISHLGNSYSLLITTPIIVTVEFEQIKHCVAFSVKRGNGNLIAMVDGKEISSGDYIPQGKNIEFIAKPKFGYRVKTWN